MWYMSEDNVIATNVRVNKYIEWKDEVARGVDAIDEEIKEFIEVEAEVIRDILKSMKQIDLDVAFIYEPDELRIELHHNKQKIIYSMPVINSTMDKKVNIGYYHAVYLYNIFRFHNKASRFKVYHRGDEGYPIILEIDDVKYAIAPRNP